MVTVHTLFRASDVVPTIDDATIDLDLEPDSATVITSGRLGPRSAGVIRTMLDALDAVPNPIHVQTEGVDDVTDEVVAALFEAEIRRRSLRLPGLVLDTPGPAVRAAVRRWTVDRPQRTHGLRICNNDQDAG